MTYLKISSIVLLAVFFASCGGGGAKFNPDFYIPSISEQAIINENKIKISFFDERVQQYGCMSKAKIIELKNLLRGLERKSSAKKVVKARERMTSGFDKAINTIDEQNK